MIIRGRLTTIPNDVPVADSTTGEIRLLSDNSLVGTVTTTDGWYEWVQNGNPGPLRIFWDYSNVIKNQYSKVIGPSGPVDVAGIPIMFRAFINGVIPNLGAQLLPAASGSDMTVSVAAGAAVVQGILYDQLVIDAYTVEPSNTNPRIDTIVIEVVPAGAGEDIEGRAEIKIIKGTPHATTPVRPTLTQTTTLYQYPIADIAVGANVTVIGSDKVTGRSTFARTTIPAGSIGVTELAEDALAIFSVKKSGGGVNSVPVNRLNFNGDHFNVDVNSGFGGKQIDIELASGGLGALVNFMPITEFVATGNISSGTRTLVTLGVGPLPANKQYAVLAYFGFTVRNNVNTGTVEGRVNINGGTNRVHEFQNVGGVPRWAPVTQSALVTRPTTSSFNVVGGVRYISGDQSDIRAGWICTVCIPYSVLGGA